MKNKLCDLNQFPETQIQVKFYDNAILTLNLNESQQIDPCSFLYSFDSTRISSMYRAVIVVTLNILGNKPEVGNFSFMEKFTTVRFDSLPSKLHWFVS